MLRINLAQLHIELPTVCDQLFGAPRCSTTPYIIARRQFLSISKKYVQQIDHLLSLFDPEEPFIAKLIAMHSQPDIRFRYPVRRLPMAVAEAIRRNDIPASAAWIRDALPIRTPDAYASSVIEELAYSLLGPDDEADFLVATALEYFVISLCMWAYDARAVSQSVSSSLASVRGLMVRGRARPSARQRAMARVLKGEDPYLSIVASLLDFFAPDAAPTSTSYGALGSTGGLGGLVVAIMSTLWMMQASVTDPTMERPPRAKVLQCSHLLVAVTLGPGKPLSKAAETSVLPSAFSLLSAYIKASGVEYARYRRTHSRALRVWLAALRPRGNLGTEQYAHHLARVYPLFVPLFIQYLDTQLGGIGTYPSPEESTLPLKAAYLVATTMLGSDCLEIARDIARELETSPLPHSLGAEAQKASAAVITGRLPTFTDAALMLGAVKTHNHCVLLARPRWKMPVALTKLVRSDGATVAQKVADSLAIGLNIVPDEPSPEISSMSPVQVQGKRSTAEQRDAFLAGEGQFSKHGLDEFRDRFAPRYGETASLVRPAVMLTDATNQLIERLCMRGVLPEVWTDFPVDFRFIARYGQIVYFLLTVVGLYIVCKILT
ncbi:hypothetical protein J8273_5478 [Carpediemonas membranifera]|uniref:Uncharacterized protein n=1 Tax=Carpediemonas membranifera TaxID=201153 RepID=A0A8J6E100_9EUKA|nr:hypothetical protein J8273_5478 [Carpediemonas membranifera]|eukprot:KAG9392486.1 hypothetical protein J8273_5478 [Carpediemonas membranifera]